MGYGIRSHLKGHRLYSYLRGRDEYAAALDTRKPLLRYIGWLGHNNIGDEALFEAFKSPLFGDCLLTPFYDLSPLSALASLKSHKLVVLGGGTLINDDSYLEPLERSQRAGIKTFVFGTGVGDLAYWAQHPNSNRGNAERWLQALDRADYVGVRGPRSLQWLHQHGITKAEVLGDPALCLTRPRGLDRQRPTLGVNLGSHDPTSGGADATHEAMAGLIQHAIQQGYVVRFIALHDIDHAIGQQLQARIAHPDFQCLPFDGEVEQTLQQIGSCDLGVGQRLHFSVLACALGVPNLSLSYQPKCLDFLESIDRADLAVPTADIDTAQLLQRFEWLQAEAPNLAEAIPAACEPLRQLQKRKASQLVAQLSR